MKTIICFQPDINDVWLRDVAEYVHDEELQFTEEAQPRTTGAPVRGRPKMIMTFGSCSG